MLVAVSLAACGSGSPGTGAAVEPTPTGSAPPTVEPATGELLVAASAGRAARRFAANLDARRKRLQEDLAIARQHPNINERDQAAHVAELTDEIDALNEAEPFAKQADDKDLHDGINRGMLKQARQELDAAVKNGDVTQEQAKAAVTAAGRSGNAASASEIVLNAVDGAGNKTAKANLPAVKRQLFVTFGGKTYPVESTEDAQRKWIRFQESADGGMAAGVSQIGNGVQITDQDGKFVARVAFNGRLFDGNNPDANCCNLAR